MVLVAVLVEESNQPKLAGRVCQGAAFAFKLQLDEHVEFLSLKLVEDILQRLPFKRDTVHRKVQSSSTISGFKDEQVGPVCSDSPSQYRAP